MKTYALNYNSDSDYNRYDPEILEMKDLNIIKSILLNGERKKIINYNEPKQLVYESIKSYYNTITKKPTVYEYRFKTEDEFKDEFGEHWMDEVQETWVHGMDNFLGKDLLTENIITDYGVFNDYDDENAKYFTYQEEGDYDKWFMSMEMIKENDKFRQIDYNTPKRLVYESKILKYKDYKNVL